MRLQRLTLSNFQGVKSLEINFGGLDTDIRSQNGRGKTTLANANSWLWTDRDTAETPGYSPKTVCADGSDAHYLEHSAEGVYETDSGEIFTLKKVYHEVYTRGRGTNTDTFTGHTTDCFTDGVPVTATEYRAYTEQRVPSVYAKILMTPDYFAETLNWKERRKILMDVFGGVSDGEVMASREEFSELAALLRKPGGGTHTTDGYRRICNAKKAEINKKLQEIPGRIGENQKYAGFSGGQVTDAEIKEAEDKRAALRKELSALESGGHAGLKQQKAELGAALAEEETIYLNGVRQANRAYWQTADALNRELAERHKSLREYELSECSAGQKIRAMSKERDRIKNAIEAVKAEEYKGETVCPACGQDLPLSRIKEAAEKFSADKKARTESLREQGRKTCSKEMIDKLEQERAAAEEQIRLEKGSVAELTEKLRQAETQIIQPDFTGTQEYGELAAKLDTVNALIAAVNGSHAEAIRDLESKIQGWDAVIRRLTDMKHRQAAAELERGRVRELEAEEKKLSAEYEGIERGLYLADEFIRSRCAMLNDRINTHFETVRFALFRKNITNDGLEEICEVLCAAPEGLVPYSKPANTASRVNASLEIMDALGAELGLAMPILIDGAESVTDIRRTAAQQIRLYVDENYPELTVTDGGVYIDSQRQGLPENTAA